MLFGGIRQLLQPKMHGIFVETMGSRKPFMSRPINLMENIVQASVPPVRQAPEGENLGSLIFGGRMFVVGMTKTRSTQTSSLAHAPEDELVLH